MKSLPKRMNLSPSNNTISRRIVDIARDIENELISRLYACDAYALQIDESTDEVGLAIIFVFVRYDFNNKNKNNLLFCKSLALLTIG